MRAPGGVTIDPGGEDHSPSPLANVRALVVTCGYCGLQNTQSHAD
jgi:hypothetical protein